MKNTTFTIAPLVITLILSIGLLGLSRPLIANSTPQEPTPNDEKKILYKTQNPDGSVSFSDTPINSDSETLEIRPTPALPIKVPRIQTFKPNPQPEHAKKVTVTIQFPEQEQTFRNINEIPIKVSIQPNYRGTRLQINHNGQVIQGRTLTQLNRGEHRLQVKAFSSNDALMGESEPHIFYVHQSFARKNAAN